jgi:hypothetical protein
VIAIVDKSPRCDSVPFHNLDFVIAGSHARRFAAPWAGGWNDRISSFNRGPTTISPLSPRRAVTR